MRPFVFPDRAATRVQSWSYRLGLSALKAVYITTGIVHHNLEGFSRGDQQTPLQEVLAGFDVRWDPDRADALSGDYDPGTIRNFIEKFLRPHGIDRPATPRMVEAIEAFAPAARHERPAVSETHR